MHSKPRHRALSHSQHVWRTVAGDACKAAVSTFVFGMLLSNHSYTCMYGRNREMRLSAVTSHCCFDEPLSLATSTTTVYVVHTNCHFSLAKSRFGLASLSSMYGNLQGGNNFANYIHITPCHGHTPPSQCMFPIACNPPRGVIAQPVYSPRETAWSWAPSRAPTMETDATR